VSRVAESKNERSEALPQSLRTSLRRSEALIVAEVHVDDENSSESSKNGPHSFVAESP